MKRILLSGLLVLTLACSAIGQPVLSWINNGTTNSPPSPVPAIDAYNVINNGQLNLVLGIQILQNQSPTPFDFSDVTNFVNHGVMTCNNGFIFNNSPYANGTAVRSVSFTNFNTGTIYGNGFEFLLTNGNIGGTGNNIGSIFGFTGIAGATLDVSASNVVNNGILEVSLNGLLSIDGGSVDMTRGSVICDGLQLFGASFDSGIFITQWGLGFQTNQIANGPANFTLPSPFSPFHLMTNTLYQPLIDITQPANATAFANLILVNPSNLTTEIVYIGNTNPAISTAVRFLGGGSGFAEPVIQWQGVVSNNLGVAIATNFLYLSDTFGARTNFQMMTNYYGQTGAPQLSPVNLDFTSIDQFGFSNLAVGDIAFDPSLLPLGARITNEYTALTVNIQAVTFVPDPNVPGQTFLNIPGRITINSDTNLTLNHTKINGPNTLALYVNAGGTNPIAHFGGSANAQIVAPNMDINLTTSDNQLTVSNLVAPYLPNIVGTVDVYSARWTNVVNGFTNSYHVLMVDSRLAPTAVPLIQNLLLRGTNLAISDELNIATNFLLDATSLTVTSNAFGSQTPYGQINVQSPNIIWSASLPVLQYVTNYGLITTPNTVYFEDLSSPPAPPFFATSTNGSYQSFVNHGSIYTSGNTTWAKYFENSGGGTNLIITNPDGVGNTTNLAVIVSTFGPVSIQATTAVLANSAIATTFGDVDFTAGSLVLSNHFMTVQGAINLTVTNDLTDDGPTSNFWTVTDGMNLPIRPAMGDLLGTTITNFAPVGFELEDVWAGQDRGPTTAGFLNNAAVGHLILDGASTDVQYDFDGPDANPTNHYALYVDLLELQNGATNTTTQNNSPFFTAFNIADNMTIYFADAILGNQDISEHLNGANGGRLIWVGAYAGIFSSTNVLYTNGFTHTLNRALVLDPDFDSNGNGKVNSQDPDPIYTANEVNLRVGTSNLLVGNALKLTPTITWYALAKSPTPATNYLYHGNSPIIPITAGNQLVITKSNFLSSASGVIFTPDGGFVLPVPSRDVTVADLGRTNSTGYYNVLVKTILP